MAAISHVFTIRRAAQILVRDEDLLWELSDQLEPEDGKLWVYAIDGAETPAFMASRLFAKLSRIRSIAPVNLKTSVPRCSAYAYARSPPIAFDPARLSSHWKLPGPPELRAVNPHAMHDHGQPTRQRHDRLLHPASLEPGPLRRTHQHALGRLVEHDPHHLISAPRYCTGSVVLARLILGGCESKHRPHRLGLPETGRRIDRDAIGERDNRSDTRDRHQAPAHIIVPDDGQQAAMQDAELLANDPPDNEQRFHQHGQIGKPLDKLLDTRLELHRPDHADLKTKVAQAGAQLVLDGDGFRLQQLAMGQQHPKLLAS